MEKFITLIITNNNIFIQYVIVIGTLITAIATLFNVRIIKKANRASYSPQIFPSNAYYVMRESEEKIPFIVEQGKEIDNSMGYAMHMAPAIIRNVGLGSAVSVKISWKYNQKNIIELLLERGKSIITHDEKTRYQFQYLKENEGEFGFVIKNPKEYDKNISSIIPGENVPIYIPETVLNYISFLNISEKRISNKSRFEYNITDCKLLIEYKDIGGKLLKQNIRINIYIYTHFRDNATLESDHSLIRFEYY